MAAQAEKSKKEGGDRYFEAVGRRKRSVARVRITIDTKDTFIINDKSLKDYFSLDRLRQVAHASLETGDNPKASVSVKVYGGGQSAQADAIRLGIARALIKYDPELRTALKQEGYLKRDPRVVERKKPGLKKARKRAQFSKR